MNGVHDMGGMHGMGPVEIEKNEPVFHSDWEARVHALNLACGFHRKWNIDMGRHSRERIPPAEYLAFSYYEKWLRGLEMLLVENGLVTPKELETCRAESKASGASVLRAPEVARRPSRSAARRRGAGVQRAVGSAGLRDDGFAARARRLRLARMGRRARGRARRGERPRRAGRRQPLLRALARRAGEARRPEKAHRGKRAGTARGRMGRSGTPDCARQAGRAAAPPMKRRAPEVRS